MDIETFEDLFYAQLCELHDVERRLVKALPKMAKASSSGRLREAFEIHFDQTKEHLRRLEEVFNEIRREPQSKPAEGMNGLVLEGEKLIKELDQSPLRDAGLIAAGNRVEHYEIASYGSAATYAHLLGYIESASMLEQTLAEEKEADEMLTRIGEEIVNREALQLGAHQHV